MGGTGRSGQVRPGRVLRRAAIATCVAGALVLLVSAAEAASAAASDPPAPTLVLQEVHDGRVICVSPEANCTVINLYGPDGSITPPRAFPGSRNTTTIQLRNASSIAASRLEITADACRNVAPNGGPIGDLCAVLTVTVSCTSPSGTFSYGPVSLTRFGTAGTHIVSNALAAGASATCRFTLDYPAGAPSFTNVVRAIQPITKTLVAAPAPPPTPAPTPAPTPPPAPPVKLPFTGANPAPFVIVGAALLALGGGLFRLSRRRDAQAR